MDFRQEGQERRAGEQDMLLAFVVDNFTGAVMHGGTCIWRCYGGRRYSKDLDFYLGVPAERGITLVRKAFMDAGFALKEFHFDRASNTLVIVERREIEGKADFTFSRVNGAVKANYARINGTAMEISALDPEGLLQEKISAHLDKYGRGADEVQDLYDVYYLTSLVRAPSAHAAEAAKRLVSEVKRPPRNERQLANYMLKGEAAPSFRQLMESITRWYYANHR